MFRKVLPFSLILLSSMTSAAESFEFNAGHGFISMEKIDEVGIYKTYEFKINGDVFARKESAGIELQNIGTSNGYDFAMVKSSTGGSGCAEEISIVKAKNNYFVFSPTIAACGGIEKVSTHDGGVILSVYERDEKTITQYAVLGSEVMQIAPKKEMAFEKKYSFFDWNNRQ